MSPVVGVLKPLPHIRRHVVNGALYRSIIGISLLCLSLTPSTVSAKDGWGCEVGPDGKWSCFWSGPGEPPEQKIEPRPAPPRPAVIQSPPPQEVDSGLSVAPRGKVRPETGPKAVVEKKTEIPEEQKESTFGRLKGWFGFGGGESTAEETASEKRIVQDKDEPRVSNPKEVVSEEKSEVIPKPVTTDVTLTESSVNSEPRPAESDVSTLGKIKGWLGWSKGKEQADTAMKEVGSEPEPNEQTVSNPPESQAPRGNQPMTEDVVISRLEDSGPVTAKIQQTEPEKSEPEPATEKPSVMGRMKRWVGLSGEDAANRDEKSEAVSRAAKTEEKPKRVYSPPSVLADIQYAPDIRDMSRDEPVSARRHDEGLEMIPVLGNKGKASSSKRNDRDLPVSMIKPETGDKERRSPKPAEKSSWLGRVGQWFGLGRKQEPVNRDRAEKVGVMPDMKIEDVPAN